MCSSWSSISPRFPFIKYRKFQAEALVVHEQFCCFLVILDALLYFVPQLNSLPPRDDPLSYWLKTPWLSSCLHSLSFLQSKTSSSRDKKNFEEKFFGISRIGIKKFKIEIDIISIVKRDKRKSRKREFRRAAKHRNFESIKYRKTYNRQRNNN